MTATSAEPCPKRQKGFTIDAIMGKTSDSRDSTPSRTTPPVPRPREIENVNERLQPPSDYSSHKMDALQRTSFPRDFHFLNANRDASVASIEQSETLKHFHEAFLQNSGTGSAFGPQRMCRHPLSSLNMSGVYPQHLPSTSQIHPMLLNNVRDIRHMYPYLAERYPGYFLPRYGVGGNPGLFFQPYRKPKRIRTAFSPSQLLQLEKAFEKSHYVVGQERKDLAAELQLSETQVKVWFQNRRTKHKRIKSEEGDGMSSPSHDNLNQSGSHLDSNEDSDISDIDDVDESVDNGYSRQYQPIHT